MSESRTEFEAMMKTYFGEAVSLAHDGAVYTDAFAGAVYLGWIQGSLAEAERFNQEMRTQAAQAQAQAGGGEAVGEVFVGDSHFGNGAVNANIYFGIVLPHGTKLYTAPSAAAVNQQLLEAIKIAIECLGLHGDGFADLGAMTVLQDFVAAIAAAQEQSK